MTGSGNYGSDCGREHASPEAQALTAILDHDLERVQEILRTFLPGELDALWEACGALRHECARAARQASTDAGMKLVKRVK